MSEIRYMISDAARQAGVEAHVLRSWEEAKEPSQLLGVSVGDSVEMLQTQTTDYPFLCD